MSQYQDAIDVIEHNERDEQKKIEKERARITEDQQLRVIPGRGGVFHYLVSLEAARPEGKAWAGFFLDFYTHSKRSIWECHLRNIIISGFTQLNRTLTIYRNKRIVS